MRADEQVNLSLFDLFQNHLLLFGGPEAAEHFNMHRPAGKTRQAGHIMLTSQHGSRHENRRLLACEHTFHHRAQRDLCLAKADIAAQQPVHRAGRFHIRLDFPDTAHLVFCLLIFKRSFKFRLPAVVFRERKACFALALGIQLQQLTCQLFGSRFGFIACFLPFRSAQLVQPHRPAGGLTARADVFGNQIQTGRGNIEKIRARKCNLDEILKGALDAHALHAHKAADAVMLMDNDIARRQVGIAAHMVAIGLFLFAGSFPARREHLSLGKHCRAQHRIFDAGRQAAVENVNAAGCRKAVGNLSRHALFLQHFLHGRAAHFARTQHNDAVIHVLIRADIGCRRRNIAGIRRKLLCRDIGERFRRTFGYRAEEGFQIEHRAAGQCFEHLFQRCLIHRIFSIQQTAREQRFHVLLHAHLKDARRLAHRAEIIEKDQCIARDIIRRCRHLRIEKREVFVRRGKKAVVVQPFDIAAQIFVQVRVLFGF